MGRHVLQIPGPTNVPDRVPSAIGAPTIDHCGPAFAALGREVLEGAQWAFRTDGHITVGANNERLWRRLCEAIGRPELADDARFASNDDQMAACADPVADDEAEIAAL